MTLRVTKPETIAWSYSDLRERLMDCANARDRGGEDGRKNHPPADSPNASAYQRDVLHRAHELADHSEQAAQDQIQSLIADMRENPFVLPGSGPSERCGEIEADTVAAIELLVHDRAGELKTIREAERGAARNHRRDFQVAKVSPPRGGWKPITDFMLTVLLVVCVEAVITFFLLRHALGWGMALLQGLFLPGFMVILGYAAGHVTLKPARHEERASLKTWGLRALAVALTAFAMILIYGVAAYRACLIEGLDGTTAQILDRASHPLSIILQWESLGLAALGVIGFAAGCWKCHEFWGGVAPPLRASGRALERAVRTLRNERDTMVGEVRGFSDKAATDLDTLVHTAREWAKAIADRTDRITAQVLELNRRRDLLQRSAESVDLDYREGNAEVRTEPCPAWPEVPFIGRYIELPPTFEQARTAARDAVKAWSDESDRTQGRIVETCKRAISRIDELAGFAAPAAPTAPVLIRKVA